jgi:hypothetical protein
MIKEAAEMINQQESRGIQTEWKQTSEHVLEQSKRLDEEIHRLEVSMKDMEKVKPFHYSHQGSLA